MDKLDSQVVMQIGIIVKDADKTAAHYAKVFGIPKPEVVMIADDSFANTNYRGKPSSAKGKAAFFNMGTVQMEIIEPVGAPSTWEEFLRTKGEGIHHIAFRSENFEEAKALLNANDMPIIQSGAWDGGRYAYIDSAAKLGTILEILNFDEEK